MYHCCRTFVFKLRFLTAVHFGTSDSALSLFTSEDHICADTLFSALCHEAASLYGEEGIDRLAGAVQKGELRFSDTMMWHSDDLYLPKPYFHSETSGEASATLRKAAKKLKWIPVSAFDTFLAALRGETTFDASQYDFSFGNAGEATKAAILGKEETLPYQVGYYRYKEDCGLWFLVSCEETMLPYLKKLVMGLGLDGIGGRITSGYGKYELLCVTEVDNSNDKQLCYLASSLADTEGRQLLLTSALPADDEPDSILDDAFYQVVRRGGFQASGEEEERKKVTQYFFDAGSVFSTRFTGTLFNAATHSRHPVYRYSVPMFMGVKV